MKEYIVKADHLIDGYGMQAVGELIRCKDCINHEPEDYCHIRDGLWYDNDFCSSGERKEE